MEAPSWTVDILNFPDSHPAIFLSALALSTIVTLVLVRLTSILHRPPPRPSSTPSSSATTTSPSHVLIVLGSGGHTAELLSVLSAHPRLVARFTRRTYLVSSGDHFSATKAIELERNLSAAAAAAAVAAGSTQPYGARTPAQLRLEESYAVVTVHRARRVHQPLYSTPPSALRCLLDCVLVLRGRHPDLLLPAPGSAPAPDGTASSPSHAPYPDLILTNGPGTGVVVVLASIILLFLGLHGPGTTGRMRTVYIESWARVKTLSLSGRLLRPLVDRFVVQWPQLKERYRGVEYVGNLMQ